MTVQFARTNRIVADQADPNTLADVLRKWKLGSMFATIVNRTITIASGTSMTLDPPCIPGTLICRVVTGTATGVRQPTDEGGTATTGVVVVSADGATLTFEAAITVARVSYIARPGAGAIGAAATVAVDQEALF